MAFSTLVTVLLVLDLFVFHRHDHSPSLRESAGWSVFWVALRWRSTAGFGGGWAASALEYLTGYVIEKSLSLDNIFVFAVIFRYFRRSAEIPISNPLLGHFGSGRSCGWFSSCWAPR